MRIQDFNRKRRWLVGEGEAEDEADSRNEVPHLPPTREESIRSGRRRIPYSLNCSVRFPELPKVRLFFWFRSFWGFTNCICRWDQELVDVSSVLLWTTEDASPRYPLTECGSLTPTSCRYIYFEADETSEHKWYIVSSLHSPCFLFLSLSLCSGYEQDTRKLIKHPIPFPAWRSLVRSPSLANTHSCLTQFISPRFALQRNGRALIGYV